MRKRLLCILGILFCAFLCGGCWNYQGLDDLDIVTGAAVDRDTSNGNYHLTFEIVDMSTPTEGGQIVAKYVEAEGPTIFDAIRNAKRKLINRLYGGNMQTLIISKQVAEDDGISGIFEEILRDGEFRETMSIVISREDTARELLFTDGIDSKIISYEIHEMLEEDNKTTASTTNTLLYDAYSAIKGHGTALNLPAMSIVTNNTQRVMESAGIALFRKDRLIGFMPVEDTKYDLFLMNKIKGGALSFALDQSDENIALEIKKSKTKLKVTVEDGQLLVEAKINIKLNVTEAKSQLDLSEVKQREALEKYTEKYLETHITDLFKKAQTQYQTDIFSLGNIVYRQDPDLWRSLKDQWDTIFQNATIEVTVKADIVSAGVLKNF